MMRKILVILTMLVLLISCGKKGSKDDPFKNLGNNKGGNSSNQVSEIEKYNLYIGVHNELLSFENSAGDYFEDAGAEEQFKKPSGSVLANFHQIPQIIEKIKLLKLNLNGMSWIKVRRDCFQYLKNYCHFLRI